MKITDYSRISTLEDDNIFLVDGLNGTKTINASDLSTAIVGRTNIWDMVDPYIPVEMRRNIWHGKNLGTSVSQNQWDEIEANTFRNMFIGDYWVIGGVTWRIVDINYWFGTGDTTCTTPHLVIMPDRPLYDAKMNDTNTVVGGYAGSKFRTQYMGNALVTIRETFGEDHILNHRELLTNAVTDGCPSAGAWYNSTVEIPNEIMIYGSYIFVPSNNGVTIPYNYTVSKIQLAAMRLMPTYINFIKSGYWLRDIASEKAYCFVHPDGYQSNTYADAVRGIRPVFGIKK